MKTTFTRLGLTVFCALSMSAFASPDKNAMPESLPFIVTAPGTNTPTITAVPSAEMTKVIADAKKVLCNRIENGYFEVWFAVDASGRIFGIGAGASTGIKANIYCSGEPAQTN